MNKREVKTKIPEKVTKKWWWRRLVFVNFDEETHTTQLKPYVPEDPSYGFSEEWNMWHRKDELTAFRYELLRRTAFPNLPEWDSVPGWLRGWVLGIIEPKPERAVCAMFAPTPPPGYASIDNWMWDLTASNDSLCRFFLHKINEERAKQDLPISDFFARITGKSQKHSVKRRGQRNRPVSWLAVEAYDIKSCGFRPLTAGERSRLSKARREIAVFEKPLRDAIEIAKEQTPESMKGSPQESLYARFIRENFLQRFASRLHKQ